MSATTGDHLSEKPGVGHSAPSCPHGYARRGRTDNPPLSRDLAWSPAIRRARLALAEGADPADLEPERANLLVCDQ
jgi:hypothetical protein